MPCGSVSGQFYDDNYENNQSQACLRLPRLIRDVTMIWSLRGANSVGRGYILDHRRPEATNLLISVFPACTPPTSTFYTSSPHVAHQS